MSDQSNPAMESSSAHPPQPEVQQADELFTHPISHPVVHPVAQSTVEPVSHPTIQSDGQSAVQQTAQAVFHPTIQSNAQPLAQSVQPTIQSSAEPIVQLAVQPVAEPVVQPAAQPAAQPVVQPAAHPEADPLVQPPAPTVETAAQSAAPHVQPEVQPAAQPPLGPEQTRRVFIAQSARTDDYLNRWLFSVPNDVVDFSTERFMIVRYYAPSGPHPISRFSDEGLQNLKMVKVFGLSELIRSTRLLLHLLSTEFTALEQLEIDQLVLEQCSLDEYTFCNLRTLSISSINAIGGRSLLCIDAPSLDSVCLGDDSINYLLFAHQDNIHHLMCDADPVGNLLQFRKLQVLQCNRIGHHSLDAVLKMAESSDLVMLCCNLDNHDSTSVQLNADQLRPLQELYDRLRESSILRNRWSKEGFPTIVLQGVQVDLAQPFSVYVSGDDGRLFESISEFYHHNFDRLFPLSSVTRIDYMQLLAGRERRFLPIRAPFVSSTTYYPNLRSVQMCNASPKLQTIGVNGAGFHRIDVGLLLRFLGLCHGLTELTLHNSRMYQDDYVQLSKLHSLTGLRKLTLFEDFEVDYAEEGAELAADARLEVNARLEADAQLDAVADIDRRYPPYQPDTPLDFDFLKEFRFLRRLRTNLANRWRMIRAVARMDLGQEFQFRFWHSEWKVCNEFTFVFTAIGNDFGTPVKRYNVSRQSSDLEGAYADLADLDRRPEVLLQNQPFKEVKVWFHWYTYERRALTKYLWRSYDPLDHDRFYMWNEYMDGE